MFLKQSSLLRRKAACPVPMGSSNRTSPTLTSSMRVRTSAITFEMMFVFIFECFVFSVWIFCFFVLLKFWILLVFLCVFCWCWCPEDDQGLSLSACDACPVGFSTLTEGATSPQDCGEQKLIGIALLQQLTIWTDLLNWTFVEPLLLECYVVLITVPSCLPGSVVAPEIEACVSCGKGEYWRWDKDDKVEQLLCKTKPGL